MTDSLQRPKVGIGVLISKEGKILMGKRKGAHGSGSWSTPGGNLDFGEEVDTAAFREVLEETNLEVKNVKFLTFTNDIFKEENKHYITLWMTAEYISGEPQIMEPEKCDAWDWFSIANLPIPLFIPLQNLLKSEDRLVKLFLRNFYKLS
jgi:8-oxo-dGTP diphosphatase